MCKQLVDLCNICLSKERLLYKDKFALVAPTHLEVGTLIHFVLDENEYIMISSHYDSRVNPYMDFIDLKTKCS